MATFSTNQSRQIYVAKQTVAAAVNVAEPGDIVLVAPASQDYIYFQYKGADSLIRTDLIQKDLVTSCTVTHGSNLKKYLHQYDIALDPSVQATPIANQEYMIRINLLGYASLGIENTYQKYGYAKATTGMTASALYLKLAKSLALNFAREPYPIYKFFVSTVASKAADVFADAGKTVTEITSTTDLSTLTGTYLKIVIQEVAGLWRKGTDEDMPQMAQIFTDFILAEGSEQRWGTVFKVTAKAQLTERTDSVYRQFADMEYFYTGERGDKYRNVGWPYVIQTEYMIDKLGLAAPAFSGNTATSGVSVIDIHYSYVGSNESSQKSEKDVCIIIPNGTAKYADKIATELTTAGIKVITRGPVA